MTWKKTENDETLQFGLSLKQERDRPKTIDSAAAAMHLSLKLTCKQVVSP